MLPPSRLLFRISLFRSCFEFLQKVFLSLTLSVFVCALGDFSFLEPVIHFAFKQFCQVSFESLSGHVLPASVAGKTGASPSPFVSSPCGSRETALRLARNRAVSQSVCKVLIIRSVCRCPAPGQTALTCAIYSRRRSVASGTVRARKCLCSPSRRCRPSLSARSGGCR